MFWKRAKKSLDGPFQKESLEASPQVIGMRSCFHCLALQTIRTP